MKKTKPTEIMVEVNGIKYVPLIRGEWAIVTGSRGWVHGHCCTVCGASPIKNEWKSEVLTNYCPYCGAEMREDEG